ncbi:MAG TPA: YceI family protein [Candidatus Binataceae bacterium]|jgi:polyisoprenoid-binding protein YceI|nr:YceI family protein [Candidatus Binataceae bacterium]
MRIPSVGLSLPPLALTLIALLCPLAMAFGPIPEGKVAVLELDPARTAIAFSLTGWPHDTHGTFRLKRGFIRVSPATGKMDGIIIVDASSGNSGETLRDAKMTSSVLEAPRFPEISFAPQQVESHGDPEGEFPVKVRGLLSLHGAQHDFTVDAVVSRATNDTTIRCSFVIPYVEWGLEDPSILMFKVSKEVRVDLTTNARLSWMGP